MSSKTGWKLWLICMLTMVLTATVSIMASVRITRENTRHQIDVAREAGRKQQQATCDLVRLILAAYEETPPDSDTGKAVQEAWLYEYRILGCIPAK